MVEIQADVTLINDKMEVMVLLNKLTKKFDRNFSHFQRSQDYLDLIDAAAKEVVGFKAKIIDMKAKFKLSQNKQKSDINVLITALRQSGDADRDTLADLIERQLYNQLKT
jgi:predicted FMN-binding regulatory protein PaiB